MRLTDVALVRLDDFYQTLIPESQVPHQTVEQRLNGVFDWARVRSEALEPLRADNRAAGMPLTSCVVWAKAEPTALGSR